MQWHSVSDTMSVVLDQSLVSATPTLINAIPKDGLSFASNAVMFKDDLTETPILSSELLGAVRLHSERTEKAGTDGAETNVTPSVSEEQLVDFTIEVMNALSRVVDEAEAESMFLNSTKIDKASIKLVLDNCELDGMVGDVALGEYVVALLHARIDFHVAAKLSNIALAMSASEVVDPKYPLLLGAIDKIIVRALDSYDFLVQYGHAIRGVDRVILESHFKTKSAVADEPTSGTISTPVEEMKNKKRQPSSPPPKDIGTPSPKQAKKNGPCSDYYTALNVKYLRESGLSGHFPRVEDLPAELRAYSEGTEPPTNNDEWADNIPLLKMLPLGCELQPEHAPECLSNDDLVNIIRIGARLSRKAKTAGTGFGSTVTLYQEPKPLLRFDVTQFSTQTI